MRQRSSRRSNLYAAAHSVRCWPRAISVSPIDILRGALRASLTRRKPRGTSQPAIRCSLGATYRIARQSRLQRRITGERSAVAGVKARLHDQEISREQFYQPQTSGDAEESAAPGGNTGRVMQMPFNKTHVAVGRREPTIRLAVRLRSRWPRASWEILAGERQGVPATSGLSNHTDADVYHLAREKAAQARTTRQKRLLWSSMIKLGLTRMPAPLFHAARRGKWRSRVRPFGGFAGRHGGLAVAERTVGKDQTPTAEKRSPLLLPLVSCFQT